MMIKVVALLCSVIASGCVEGATAVVAPEAEGAPTAVPTQEILASVEGDCIANEPCEIRVIVSSTGRAVGAYQGRLRLDPRSVRLVRGPSSRDAFHLVNPALSTAGDLRFAGFSATGEQRIEALAATVIVTTSEELGTIRAELDVAADAAGVRIGEGAITSVNRIVLSR